MTDKKNEDKDWEFNSIDFPKKSEEDNKKNKVRNTHVLGDKRKDDLVLDVAAAPRVKTRSAMAIEMEGEVELKDEYDLAPLPKRAAAFFLDTIFLGAMLFAVKFCSPLLRKIIQYPMDTYKFKFIIPEPMVMNAIMIISGFLALYFFIVIPVAFFNTSFGKKILGLRIRGKEKYTISISEAFKRELIMKPLSIAIIAGFITPFISKKRLSIHDMLTDTFVIDE